MIKKFKIGLLIAVLSLAVGVGSAHAANLSWGADTTVALISPVENLTIANGSAAATLVVEAGDIIVTADSVGTFTVQSADLTLVPSSTTGVTKTCTAGVSRIVIAAGTAALTISTTSPQCGSGSSGGGGGGNPPAADTTAPIGTISINAGATTASLLAATLTLSATDNVAVTQMLISNDSGFAGATWESYATSKSWTLTSGDGAKTVYAKFKDAAGNTSVTASDVITVSGSGTVALPPTLPTEGCSGGNLYNTSTGALCVNNAGSEIPGCGNRNTGFSTASGVSCVGNRVTSGTPNAPGASGYNFGTGILKNGSKGAAVKELQRFLNDKLNLGLVLDGKLGPKTIAVIKKWQKAHGLVADGLVGPKTKAQMHAEE